MEKKLYNNTLSNSLKKDTPLINSWNNSLKEDNLSINWQKYDNKYKIYQIKLIEYLLSSNSLIYTTLEELELNHASKGSTKGKLASKQMEVTYEKGHAPWALGGELHPRNFLCF